MTEVEVNFQNCENEEASVLGWSGGLGGDDDGSHLGADAIGDCDAPPGDESGKDDVVSADEERGQPPPSPPPTTTAAVPATQTPPKRQQRKRKHRRGKPNRKRKLKRWKPYYERTWAEKREVDEREARRAESSRAERWAHGQAVAPYNTTSFLMEDEDHRSANKEDDCSSVEEDAEMDFLQREFSAVYDSLHAERIGAMSKLELVQEYLFLEDRVEKLEMALGAARVAQPPLPPSSEGEQQQPQPRVPSATDQLPDDEKDEMEEEREETVAVVVKEEDDVLKTWSAEQAQKVRIFQREIRKLAAENSKLRRENDVLRTLRDRNRTTEEEEVVTDHDEEDDDDEDEEDDRLSDAVCVEGEKEESHIS